MGRHAGFLTAASALARKFPDDGPHLIYVPERAFVVDKFLADVKATYEQARPLRDRGVRRHPRRHGAPIITKLAKARWRTTRTATCSSPAPARSPTCCARRSRPSSSIKRVRGDTFGYLQRSFIGCVSDVDQREAREVGEKAVQFAMWGEHERLGGDPPRAGLRGRLPLMPLEAVAGKTRVMEDEFIAAAGNDVTEVLRLPAAAAGLGHARSRAPARRQGRQERRSDRVDAVQPRLAIEPRPAALLFGRRGRRPRRARSAKSAYNAASAARRLPSSRNARSAGPAVRPCTNAENATTAKAPTRIASR